MIGPLLVYFRLPDYREKQVNPVDLEGLILFGSGIALLSYVLEVFGEHTLSSREIGGLLAISVALLAGYGLHGLKTPFPLIELGLFRIRTFRAAVSGSFVTRLGISGVPFLLPLLYQVGLGFAPIQSGLLIMPQALAAIGMKFIMPRLLTDLGYRGVLVSNTVIPGLLLLAFASIGIHTPVWAIAAMAFCYGCFTPLQYTSLNALVYADIGQKQTSNASSIASTMQQMSVSFGLAAASIATAVFVQDRFHSSAKEMMQGIHGAFLVLGGLTIVSTMVFLELEAEDGAEVSQQKVLQPIYHPGG